MQFNRWILEEMWNSYSQGVDTKDLQEEILFYLQEDQQDEFWLVVEDQNEPLLIGWINFIYGMHIQEIPKQYKERFLMWMFTYSLNNPDSLICAFCESGIWDADALQMFYNSHASSNFWKPIIQDIVAKEVPCRVRMSEKTKKTIVPHSSFSKIFVRKYLFTEYELFSLHPQSAKSYLSPTSLLPLSNQSPFQVMKLCNTLSKKNNLEPFYVIETNSISTNVAATGYRIPTQAEWLHLARCDTKFDYSGGQIVDYVGWYQDNSKGQKHIVGQKSPNKWGIFDMTGNVDELVHKNVVRSRIQNIDSMEELTFRATDHFTSFGGTYMNNEEQVSLQKSCHRNKKSNIGSRYYGIRLLRYA